MTWRDRRFSKPFYMHQLSEGILRFLWLVAILQSPGLPAVTMIDEPEVSLHPELLALLAELLREASTRTQLIVATHSDRLVRFLDPKEVVAMDINEDGTARATWADTLDLGRGLEHGPHGGAIVKIALIVEGRTEKVFLPHLRAFLQSRLPGKMPKLDPVLYNGRIPTRDKLRRQVETLLDTGKEPADAVIALTDVYTGSQPPDFADAADAKAKMRGWVGANEKFYPHAAQYDFEAWLLPYWERIQQLAKSNRACPGQNPERVNHIKPPAHLLREVFSKGDRGQAYVKTRDADRILRGQDLLVAARACAELKAFLNTIMTLCGGNNATIP
jgi:hypothetical protein